MTEIPPKHFCTDGPLRTIPLREAEKVLGVTAATACARYARLTVREAQVAAMVAAGKANREIAVELGLSDKTVDIHRAHVKFKLELRTPVQVANLVNLVRLAEAAEPKADSTGR